MQGYKSQLALVLLVLLMHSLLHSSDSTIPRESLVFSCLDKPFVSVAAMGPKHDGFPAVELVLTDPKGRNAGLGHNRIPHSSYGNIVEMKRYPERSKARAVEVCNAEQGIYALEVHELSNERYLLEAKGEDGDAANSAVAILKHVGEKGRVRRYYFKFTIIGPRLDVSWLDGEGREQLVLEVPEW